MIPELEYNETAIRIWEYRTYRLPIAMLACDIRCRGNGWRLSDIAWDRHWDAYDRPYYCVKLTWENKPPFFWEDERSFPLTHLLYYVWIYFWARKTEG